MKLIFEGDPLAKTIIGKKGVDENKTYRWSDFVFPLSHKGENYVFNNLTKRCYAVGDGLIISPEARYSSSEIADNKDLTMLVDDLFLVPEDKDEAAFYEGIVKIARVMKEKNIKKGCKSFVILPTTACNARCVYCFEQGMKYVTMTDETVDQTIRFILENARKDSDLKISWFGGEPLIGEKTIDRVSAALKEAGISFKAIMVTNGSLITSEIIEKYVNSWNVLALQITLDGIEEEYNRRKNYYFNYDSAYWHVLGKIKMVNDARIRLCIRVNLDENNIDGFMQMLGDIRTVISHPEDIMFDVVPLFDVHTRESGIAVMEKIFEILEYLETTEFDTSKHVSVKSLRLRHCMADAGGRSVTIAPDGKLYNCENIGSFDSIGTVYDGITNTQLLKDFSVLEKTREKCRGCVSLPDCTTFSRCETPEMHCKYSKKKYLELALKEQLDNGFSKDDEQLDDE